jgi:putative pyrroloquinoline-quinone binding quinoprotein
MRGSDTALSRQACSWRVACVLGICALLVACGASASPSADHPRAPQGALPSHTNASSAPSGSSPRGRAAAQLTDWPEFGLDAQRSDAGALSTGITAVNVRHLRHVSLSLPGTVDSSPIYLHGASVAGAAHDTVIVTTTYGRTLALDASSGRTLWTFTPRGYSSWAGSPQITTASPIADPDRRFVYASSPNGLIHKLSLADGREAPGWPVSVTRDATHEKLAAALNIDGAYLLAATGGYFGDAPPYQGHVVAIDRESGHIAAVYNTLCSNRRRIIVPSSCPSSDSAVLSRGGPIVEPGGARILIDTGNGPWNGSNDFGDSVIELSFPGLRYRQSFAPINQAYLNESDTDLGSSAPALLGHDRVLVGGKDGVLRLLALSQLDGHAPSSRTGAHAGRGRSPHPQLGGEVQRLPLPGGGQLFTQPAVWQHGARTSVFVADEHSTAAYSLVRARLHELWQAETPGTSPVLAGGLLYVYNPAEGGIEVYRPSSSHPIARLPGSPGHWNSPIVVDGHVIEPEGDANEHSLSGRIELFST